MDRDGSTRQTKKRGPKPKLEGLPPHIKDVLHRLIALGLGSKKCKQAIEKKFKDDPGLIIACRRVYDSYLASHKNEISRDKSAHLNVFNLNERQRLDEGGTSDSAMDVNKNEVKGIFRILFKGLGRTLQSIQAQENKGELPSPEEYKQLYKTGKEVLEIYHKYGDMLDDPQDQTDIEEMKSQFLYEMAVAAGQAYQEVHGSDRLEEYSEALDESLQIHSKNYNELFNKWRIRNNV